MNTSMLNTFFSRRTLEIGELYSAEFPYVEHLPILNMNTFSTALAMYCTPPYVEHQIVSVLPVRVLHVQMLCLTYMRELS